MNTDNRAWRKSRYSGGTQNDCVELSVGAEDTMLRDTKNHAGGTLLLTPTKWSAFLTAVKDGTFGR